MKEEKGNKTTSLHSRRRRSLTSAKKKKELSLFLFFPLSPPSLPSKPRKNTSSIPLS